MFDIKENLKKLPDTPGVYMHKDSLGQVIYVGKAVSLRNRVRQYFQSYGKSTPKLRALTSQITEFEYITCDSEMEALILECNLIKKYQPKYNVLLRDDKTYPYILITTKEEYPRLLKTRELKNDGNKYFGPFSDVGAVNRIVELLQKTYQLKRCSLTEFRAGHRPCLNYHIGQCRGICLNYPGTDKTKIEDGRPTISKEEYASIIKKVEEFISGKNKELIKELKKEMDDASERMDFEEAARLRDLILSAEELSKAQRVTMVSGKDMDVVLPIRDEDNSFVVMFQVRDGKLIGRETFEISSERSDAKDVDLTEEFIKQYYTKWADVPHDIFVEERPEGADLLESLLGKDKHKVRIHVPMRGENKAVLELAKKDRDEMIKTLSARKKHEDQKRASLREEMENLIERALETGSSTLELPGHKVEYRVEAYDISNTNGVDSVGAMVVFRGNRKVRKDYRRFKIKTVTGPDDYASLEEMITRRLVRAQKGDPAFKELPDIIFMDGGLGQITSAKRAMEKAGIWIPVVGMAKDDSHRTRAIVFEDGSKIDLKENGLLFKYVGTIQEEVHRFAIDYHRGLHGKRAISSVLDEIPGIGPVRRNALLKAFGSVEKIKAASKEELTEIAEMDAKSAQNILDFFSKRK